MKFDAYTYINDQPVGHALIDMTEDDFKNKYGSLLSFNDLSKFISQKGHFNTNNGAYMPLSVTAYAGKVKNNVIRIEFIKIDDNSIAG